MKCAEVIQYCKGLPKSALKPLNKPGTHISFVVNNEGEEKAFAFFETGAPIQWQFSVRVTEEQFESMQSPPRIRAADKPDGYWITIARVENYDEDELIDLIQWSYQQARQQASTETTT